MSKKPSIFIDGEAGTTGLQIRDRLKGRTDLELVSIDPARRKDASARKELLNSVDVAILCLPDDAAIEAVSLIDAGSKTRVIDASTAFRINPDWAYGFPELDHNQTERISEAKRVANPGCWPQGFIALVKPLIMAGMLPKDVALSYGGISGYSGGGKKMIEDYEAKGAAASNFAPYALHRSQSRCDFPTRRRQLRPRHAGHRATSFEPAEGWRQRRPDPSGARFILPQRTLCVRGTIGSD
jgi:N-acetyl-gamma-glutamyl-phosphate reductase